MRMERYVLYIGFDLRKTAKTLKTMHMERYDFCIGLDLANFVDIFRFLGIMSR